MQNIHANIKIKNVTRKSTKKERKIKKLEKNKFSILKEIKKNE